ncbi:hypothetical protein D3C73_1497490 [compost metagenome]
MPLPLFLPCPSKCDTLEQDDIISDLARFPDDDPHAVIDEQPIADDRPRMNFDSRHETPELGDGPRQRIPAMPV